MSPELQKGRVYYRCQGSNCATKTVREDVLDEFIHQTLSCHQISPSDAKTLEKDWLSSQDQAAQDDLRASIQMRVDAAEQGMNRATDLLIEGTLDNETYLAKKKEAALNIAQLRDELRKLPDPAEIKANTRQFIELMKTLSELYEILELAEKREFIENAFSNRTVVGKKPMLMPHSWLEEAETGLGVLNGAPHRDTDRTDSEKRDKELIQKIMNLKEKAESDEAA